MRGMVGSLPYCDSLRSKTYPGCLLFFRRSFKCPEYCRYPLRSPDSARPCPKIVEPRAILHIYIYPQQVPEHHAEALKARLPSKSCGLSSCLVPHVCTCTHAATPRCHAAMVTNFGNPSAARSPSSFGTHKVHGPIYIAEEREMGLIGDTRNGRLHEGSPSRVLARSPFFDKVLCYLGLSH